MTNKLLLATLGLLGSTACSPNTSGSRNLACEQLGNMASAVPLKRPHGTVFTIVIENHSASQVIGSSHAPYVTSLAHKYAVANGYHDSYVHPSEANYLWMASGQNFDVLDDDDPIAHSLDSTSHIADQIEAAGLTWRSYQEAMGEPCGLKSHGRYAAKHNPFVFFSDVNGWDGTQFQPSKRCNEHVVDFTNLKKDIEAGTVPNYAFITPDLDHDMHDGTIEDSDKWLQQVIPMIQASDAYKNGGVIFLLGDEGGGYPAEDDPPFIVISEHAKRGFQSYTDFDTSSYLKTVEKILGIAPLPCDPERDGIETMDEMFSEALVDPVVDNAGSGSDTPGGGSSATTVRAMQ